MSSPSTKEDDSPASKLFKFPSHQSHMVSLAKMCRDSNQFADCVIQCEAGGQVRGHKLVLGSASKFLKEIFKDVPASMNEATIVVPGVKEKVVASLLDFLYTGEMSVSSEDTADLQLLIDTLQIDPSLIQVTEDGDEDEDENEETETTQNPEKSGSSEVAESENQVEEQVEDETSAGEPGEVEASPKNLPAKRKAERGDVEEDGSISPSSKKAKDSNAENEES